MINVLWLFLANPNGVQWSVSSRVNVICVYIHYYLNVPGQVSIPYYVTLSNPIQTWYVCWLGVNLLCCTVRSNITLSLIVANDIRQKVIHCCVDFCECIWLIIKLINNIYTLPTTWSWQKTDWSRLWPLVRYPP